MNEYKIPSSATIIDALKQIDSISSNGTKTLFVINNQNQVIGSLSDGDCRRGLITNIQLNGLVEKVMNKNFIYLTKNKYDINIIKLIKENGIKYVPELNEDKTLNSIINFSEGRSYLPMDAVLMAGGKGERLKPLTLTTPKPLLKVADKPIIDYNISNLLHNGIKHINVTVNYLKEQLETHFENPIDGIKINCVREPSFLGTIGSIKLIKQWYNDTILVMNSDLFTNVDLENLYIHFLESNSDMTVAGVPYTVNIPYGILKIETSEQITGITEKPSYYYYANAGIYIIKKQLLDMIPQTEYFDATDLINLLVMQNKKITYFPITGYWIDIGKPEDYLKVQEFAKNINK